MQYTIIEVQSGFFVIDANVSLEHWDKSIDRSRVLRTARKV